MNDAKTHAVLCAAVKLWGRTAQIHMLAEECSELAVEALHDARGRPSGIAEEIADVEIMCAQARVIFGDKMIDAFKVVKLQRLADRIAAGKAVE